MKQDKFIERCQFFPWWRAGATGKHGIRWCDSVVSLINSYSHTGMTDSPLCVSVNRSLTPPAHPPPTHPSFVSDKLPNRCGCSFEVDFFFSPHSSFFFFFVDKNNKKKKPLEPSEGANTRRRTETSRWLDKQRLHCSA